MGPSTLREDTSRKRRVRHALLPVCWPTREEAARSRWFSPLRLGVSVVARERTWVPAMVPWRATDDGVVTPEVLDWYGRFAEGRPGVLVVEATGIRDIPSGPLLRIGHDRFVDGLARLARAVHEASGGETLLFIQLIDFLAIRRRPPRDKYFARFLALEPHHREALAQLTGDPQLRDAPEDDVRTRLAALPATDLHYVLTPRELEDLEQGYRERV